MTDFVRVPPSSIYTPLKPIHWGSGDYASSETEEYRRRIAELRETQRIENEAHESAVQRLRAFADDDPDLLQRLNDMIEAYERSDDPGAPDD